MNNDDNAVQGGVPGERREPSLPKTVAPLRYDRTPPARRAPQLRTSALPSHSGFTAITGVAGHGTGYGVHAGEAGGSEGRHGGADDNRGLRGGGGNNAMIGATTTRLGGAGFTLPVTRVAAPLQSPGGTDGRVFEAASVSRATAEPPVPELERMKGVGDTLNGRFVLEECIGFGGMGMVYKALDLRKLEASDRKPYIAIKVLNVQFRGHPKSLIALQREARKAQALAHPNIVAVYDFDRDGSMVYLTMEYLIGEPLSRSLRAPDFAGMPLARAMPVISGMAKALAYAHQRGFVHCDLKPANVFLTERGDVKVIDFGIARVFQKTEDDQDATVFDAGSLGGLTPAYASPEMLEHRVPDPRDDIYALACITHELLTGRHPFDRLSAIQARGSGMKPERPPGLGRRHWRALRAGLEFERKARMPSALRFLEEIESATRIPAAVAAAGGGAVVLLCIAFFLHQGDGPADQGNVVANPNTNANANVNADAGAAATAPAGAGPIRQEMTPSKISTAPGSVEPAPSGAPSNARPVPPRGSVSFEKAPMGGPPQIAQSPGQQGAANRPPVLLATVTPVVSRVPCSAMTAAVSDHAVDIRGFLSENYSATRLKAQLAKLPNVESVNLDIRTVPGSACATINLLAPYWQKSRQSGAGVHTRAENGQMTEGQPLVVDVTTPNENTWVYVDYFILDGGVAHLLPSLRARDNQAPPSYNATIGSFGNWIISKPFGAEFIVLMTTPAPLFNGLRPEHETAPGYLRAVKKQLREMTAKYGQDRIAVDIVQINTRAQAP